MAETPLYYRSARELAALIKNHELSAVEVMKAFLARIEEANSKLNVIVSRLPESEALKLAESADRAIAADEPTGPLHGLPTAVKDLNAVKGFPTRFGSRAHLADPPCEHDAGFVARIRRAGALIIGKTNAPEYGVGTLTFNEVFGVTRNPWDLTRHAGGSSGAGAAVAAGLLPIADGSDSGGSIRYPASFCNIVGLAHDAGPRAIRGARGRLDAARRGRSDGALVTGRRIVARRDGGSATARSGSRRSLRTF